MGGLHSCTKAIKNALSIREQRGCVSVPAQFIHPAYTATLGMGLRVGLFAAIGASTPKTRQKWAAQEQRWSL
jgi:hypothetical protein